jgi:uncharacterized protein (TIGR00369 family)
MDGLPEGVPRPPYYETLGIEITAVESGYAEGRLPVDESVSAVPEADSALAHGGAVASLADSVGYWAVSSANDFATTPTIDLRVDYLAPASDDLHAAATVVRNGESVGTVDVDVETDDGAVATARGVFKTGGGSPDSAWGAFDG